MGMRRFPVSGLPQADWPAADRAALEAALKPAGRFVRGGLAAGWQPQTVETTFQGYAYWLGWLRSRDDLDPSVPLADRVTLGRVESYVDALEEHLAPVSVAGRIRDLAESVRVLAPGHDVTWLRRIAGRLQSSACPSRKTAERIVYTPDLVDAGWRLIERARWSRLTPREAACHFQDGLMVGFLALRPVRLANLHSMELGRNVRIDGERVRVHFAAEEVKTHRSIDVPWPAAWVPVLHEFLAVHRPVLLKGMTSDRLWMGNGAPLGLQGCQTRIAKATRLILGKPLSPHLFRHCAATTVAVLAPEEVEIIASILGHTTLVTAQKHYNQANTLQAARVYQDRLDALIRGDQEDDPA